MRPKIYCNGNIYTFNNKIPHAEAIVVYNDKIMYIGSSKSALSRFQGEVIDLNGATVLPGLIDSHIHLDSLAVSYNIVNLSGCQSIDEVKERLRKQLKKVKRGMWILGRGWDHELFKERRMPTRYDLDEVSTENPVFIIRVCGHVGVANSIALKKANITRETKDPPRGIICRDDRGEPNGILYEEALELVKRCIPQPSVRELARLLMEVAKELNSYGITMVGAVSARPQLLRALRRLEAKGKLTIKTRLYMELRYLNHMVKLGIEGGLGSDMVKIVGVKVFMDGSLGGRSAALREPYNDEPSNKGLLMVSHKELGRIITLASRYNLMIAVHAIGDLAIEETLKAIEATGRNSLVRIEHASVTPPDILEFMSKVKPRVVVVQPCFRISDWWIKERLGNRARYTYAYRSMINKELILAGSSDSPVETPNPWHGIWASTCLFKDESLSVLDSIKMYTVNGGIALGEEGYGVLKVGGKADFTVLNKDPFNTGCDGLKQVQALMTVVNGNVVYSSKQLIT